MDKFEKNFLQVAEESEKFCADFIIKDVPEEYSGVWVPDNEVRAWAVPRSSAEFLRLLATISRPKVTLELGTSFGYSTLWLAAAARDVGGKVYTVELIKPKIEIAERYFRKAGLDGHVHQIHGEIGAVLAHWDKKTDFVFIDADKVNYLRYLNLLEPNLKVGSVIVADNASDCAHLMKDYLAYVKESPDYTSYLLSMDHGLMVSMKRN